MFFKKQLFTIEMKGWMQSMLNLLNTASDKLLSKKLAICKVNEDKFAIIGR